MCESIELKKRTGEDNIDTERVTFYEYGEYHNKFVRALRWVTLPKNINMTVIKLDMGLC